MVSVPIVMMAMMVTMVIDSLVVMVVPVLMVSMPIVMMVMMVTMVIGWW